MLKDLIKKNRSYRRFYNDRQVPRDYLENCIALAQMSASAANRQPLKYILVNDERKNALIFSTLAWAGYLKEWSGPEKNERPTAYIIMLGDIEISNRFEVDAGIAAQSILLGATEQGMGGVCSDQLTEISCGRICLSIRDIRYCMFWHWDTPRKKF